MCIFYGKKGQRQSDRPTATTTNRVYQEQEKRRESTLAVRAYVPQISRSAHIHASHVYTEPMPLVSVEPPPPALSTSLADTHGTARHITQVSHIMRRKHRGGRDSFTQTHTHTSNHAPSPIPSTYGSWPAHATVLPSNNIKSYRFTATVEYEIGVQIRIGRASSHRQHTTPHIHIPISAHEARARDNPPNNLIQYNILCIYNPSVCRTLHYVFGPYLLMVLMAMAIPFWQ